MDASYQIVCSLDVSVQKYCSIHTVPSEKIHINYMEYVSAQYIGITPKRQGCHILMQIYIHPKTTVTINTVQLEVFQSGISTF